MVDYNTLQRRRNMVVGGFVLIAFCAFVYLLFLFGELPVAVSGLRSFEIFVDFPNAQGIQENTRVNYCGYQIGRVTKVWPPQKNADYQPGEPYHQVRVKIAIERRKDFNIPENVKVYLMKRGLGSSYIDMVFEPDLEITGMLQDGMLLIGEEGTSTEFIPRNVQDRLERLVESISELANHANDIVGDQDNKHNIKQTLANITKATEQANETLKSVKSFTELGSDKLNETSVNLNRALIQLSSIMAKIDEGQGTAGRFVNDGRLYEDLLDTVLELELALEQIKIFAAEAKEKGLKLKF